MASIAAGYGVGILRRKAIQCAAAAVITAAVPTGAPRAAPNGPIRILAFGDSLSAGYGLSHDAGFESQLQAALRAKGYNVVILDGAVSGDTTAGGRARLDWALADNPDAVIVELGGNDALRGIDPRETEANVAAILDALQAKRIPVLLSGMYAPPNLGPDYQKSLRAMFERLGGRPGIIYDPFFLQGVAADPGLNQLDRIHPNAEGVHRIVARLLPFVERLIAEIRQP
jgi:acyl-CoA thioesterase-1